MTPEPSTTITMTVASASAEVRVSYQLFQSSSMRWPLSSARPALLKMHSVERSASATKNAMVRFVARVLIARQHDLRRTCIEAATIRTPVYRANVDYGSRSRVAGNAAETCERALVPAVFAACRCTCVAAGAMPADTAALP